MKLNSGQVLQAIYDEELNFEIVTFWDGGFTFKLGDCLNGYKETRDFYTFEEGVHWLRSAIWVHYGKVIKL